MPSWARGSTAPRRVLLDTRLLCFVRKTTPCTRAVSRVTPNLAKETSPSHFSKPLGRVIFLFTKALKKHSRKKMQVKKRTGAKDNPAKQMSTKISEQRTLLPHQRQAGQEKSKEATGFAKDVSTAKTKTHTRAQRSGRGAGFDPHRARPGCGAGRQVWT